MSTLAIKTREDAAKEPAVIMPYEHSEEYFVEELGEIEKKPVYAFVKRAADMAVALVCSVLFLVPMLIIALLVKTTSRGSVFYHQERLGLNGKKIDVLKFRTMRMDAEEDGIRWSGGKDDPRITKFGRILRNTHLDELPQLWCILTGQMTLVGPRPEREVYYNEFEQYIHGFHERLKVKPGLTGLAQVRGGYFLKPEEKIVYDVEYIKTRSLWLDTKILFETVRVVFRREGVK